MGRLGVLFVAIALLVNPDFRSGALPYARWALDPAYAWLVRARVEEIARAIDEASSAGRPVPTTRELPAFLQQRYGGDGASVDPWGEPFFFQRDMWTIRVASAGPDRQPFTGDDIFSPPLKSAER